MESAESVVKAHIKSAGPMDVGQFMALALGHPKFGYYMTRDPLGARGDFTTAPEISQIFGEMVAVCMAEAWLRAGSPDAHLVELGPGRGTLMADILRATKGAPDFVNRVQVHLVETSPVLRAAQKAKLPNIKVTWHDSVETLPTDAPLLMVANEFFDALPMRQAIMTERGWHERVVGLDGDTLSFGSRASLLPLPPKPVGTIIEFAPAREAVMDSIAARFQKQGGLLLAMDYGHDLAGAIGDTFQAVRKHGFCPPLEHVGDADLTSHVDFARLAQVAESKGCAIYGPITQKVFLESLGIRERLNQFLANSPDATELVGGVERVTQDGGMGTLFKVMAVAGNVTFCPLKPAGFHSLS